jgi:predicted DNA-binding transcriptional regulator AlpA
MSTPRVAHTSTHEGAPAMSRRAATSTATHLTVVDFCAELGIARSTFYDWRAKGAGPRCIKLPNGELRIRRAEVAAWLDNLEEVAA